MADADFGYVGGAPGKVNLYVGKELVERHVPEAEAMSAADRTDPPARSLDRGPGLVGAENQMRSRGRLEEQNAFASATCPA